MNQEERDRIARATELCRRAADVLGEAGSFRLRVLLQMLLVEARRHAPAEPDARGDDAKGRSRPAP